jgi:hypothetical protein
MPTVVRRKIGSGEKAQSVCRRLNEELRHSVSRLSYFVLILAFTLGACLFAPEYTVLGAQAQPQALEEKKPAAGQAAPTGTVQEAAKDSAPTGAPEKLANKPKRVITNDDIKSSPYAGFGGLFYTNSGSINDCNESCFDQVRMFAQPGAEKAPNWRVTVLRQLDLVRSSGEWQAYLHELYDAHNKICQLTFDQSDELRRSGNTRNLGPQEIAITDKYDAQLKTAQSSLSAAVARQTAVQGIFAEKPYANSFAVIQGTRMQGGFCSQARVIYLP